MQRTARRAAADAERRVRDPHDEPEVAVIAAVVGVVCVFTNVRLVFWDGEKKGRSTELAELTEALATEGHEYHRRRATDQGRERPSKPVSPPVCAQRLDDGGVDRKAKPERGIAMPGGGRIIPCLVVQHG
jgi:hypothetical protein